MRFSIGALESWLSTSDGRLKLRRCASINAERPQGGPYYTLDATLVPPAGPWFSFDLVHTEEGDIDEFCFTHEMVEMMYKTDEGRVIQLVV